MSYTAKSVLFLFNLFLISMFLFQYTSFGSFPGDSGDTKVVLMMLENFYSAISSSNKNFLNFNILYPIKNTAFFSETMWGVAWIYSIFRYLGFHIYEAFNLYFITVVLINFIASFYVFHKLKLSIFSSYIGAFIFSCSLPVVAQDVHFHLFFRAAIPLMVLYLICYFDTKITLYLSSSIFLLVFQFLCSMYLGVFSFLLFFILFIVKTKPDAFKFKLYFLNAFEEVKSFLKNQNKLESIFFYLILLLFITYCIKYISVKMYFDFSRGLPDKGLLVFQSFLTTSRSPLIPFIALPKGYPLTEQQAYIGLVPIMIFIMGVSLKVYKMTNTINKDILLSGLVLLILFFSIGPLNIYFLIYMLPGLDGIRAPSRVVLILLFPIALFIGITIDKIIYKYFKLLPLIILILSWGEVYFSKKSISKINIETNLDKSYFKNIPKLNKEDILVFKNTDKNGWNIPMDTSVALYAAEKNIKLMNGFTSFVPKGLGRFQKCDDIKKALNYLESYKEKNLTIESNVGYWNIIPIGFKPSCKSMIFKN